MNLSSELISQFVKVTKDDKKVDNGSTVYGTIVMYNGSRCVKLDGSDQITPITTTTDAIEGDRVAVLIKDHKATVTGNITSPSARKEDVDGIGASVKEHGDRLDEFENIVADTVTTDQLSAVQANIETLLAEKIGTVELEAQRAEIDELLAEKATVEELNAAKADIEEITGSMLTVEVAEATYATIKNLDATNANVNNLNGTFADFEETTTNKLNAVEADIKDLDAEKLDANWANIDFANMDKATIGELFSESGIIKDLVMSNGAVTGELVGVTIKGDWIEAGTLKAESLIVKGSDGLYYKLNAEAGVTSSEVVTEEELQNGIHGTVIIAKSITAEKINVDDLSAFNATIGGFKITAKAIYSGVKETIDNTTKGVYLDNEGQMSLGDKDNYLKYYKENPDNPNSDYKLDLRLGGKTVDEKISDIEIGSRNLIRNSTTLIFENYFFETDSIEITVTDYGDGTVAIEYANLMVSDNDDGTVTIVSDDLTVTDNNGTVTISS